MLCVPSSHQSSHLYLPLFTLKILHQDLTDYILLKRVQYSNAHKCSCEKRQFKINFSYRR